jgi:hypothetical protein
MITVNIVNGPNYQVPYTAGMNAQQAIEATYNSLPPQTFTYALVYYGASFGYLVTMINETYDTYSSNEAPYFFWEFLVNGNISSTGIDGTILNDGDTISFDFTVYTPAAHNESTMHVKYSKMG